MIQLKSVSKKFKLFNQQNAIIPVIENANLNVNPGECVALVGASGSGKSTLMRMIYGNYLATSGSILVDGIDLTTAEPREILEVRKRKLGYVSQFLRVVPREPLEGSWGFRASMCPKNVRKHFFVVLAT